MTLLGRWPRPKHSSDRAVIGNALRCCLRISSASCGLAACDCAGRAVPSSSSCWRRLPRTCAGWLSSSPGRHRWPPQVWRERQVALALRRQRRRFKAIASTERVAARRQGAICLSHRRLLQQNLPLPDVAVGPRHSFRHVDDDCYRARQRAHDDGRRPAGRPPCTNPLHNG